MRTLVLISANAEWRSIKQLYPGAILEKSPFGEYFHLPQVGSVITFFHGGWGKISAAATIQYGIDHFNPDLIINLGTCGGLHGYIEAGTLILVEKTVVYDIIEQMTDPDEAIAFYSTDIDLSWLQEPLPDIVQRGLLVSADRDLVVEDIPMLVSRFGAVAVDWESGAIAWVANKNQVRCLILRGVSDLVGAGGGEVYGNFELYQQRTDVIMQRLVANLGNWIELASRQDS